MTAESPSRPAELGVLGSFRLLIDGQPVSLALSAQRLVSYVALHDGALLRRHVAGVLWGDTTDEHSAGSLRTALWRAGQPGAPIVESTGRHVRLAPTIRVDLRESERLARRILSGPGTAQSFDVDESLLSVDILPDWTEDWVLLKREYHTQLRLRALEALCGRLSEMGRHGEAVQAGLLAVAGEPLRESAQRVLIRAHLAEGNTAAATKQFVAFRAMMLEQLRLEPSPDLRSLVASDAMTAR